MRETSNTRALSAIELAEATGFRYLHYVLLFGFLLLSFVDTGAFTGQSATASGQGNFLDRGAMLILVPLAFAAALHNATALLACLRFNAWLWAAIGICVASTLWSDFPELTLRRSLFMVFVAVLATGVAAGITDLRRFHTNLFGVLTAIMVCNLVVIALFPGFAITELGAAGIYSNKNVAGMVAMMAVICGTAWVLGSTRTRDTLLGLLALAPAVLLLILARSKTGAGLAALAALLFGVQAVAERLKAPIAVWSTFIGLALAATATVAFYGTDQLMLLVFNDSSFTGRDELWDFALNVARERPWLGHGYGAFWDVGFADDPLQRLTRSDWLSEVEIGVINEAHNGYLDLWIQVGLPTTILAVTGFAGGCVAIFRRAMQEPAAGARWALAAAGMLIFSHLLHNVLESTFLERGSPYPNLVILCLMVGACAKDLRGTPPAGSQSRTPLAWSSR